MKRSFFFHFNKPLSRQRGKPTMTVHERGLCHYVDHIQCTVPVSTRHRNSQPNVVMSGRGHVEIRVNRNETLAIIKEDE